MKISQSVRKENPRKSPRDPPASARNDLKSIIITICYIYAIYLPEGVDVCFFLHRDTVAGEAEHEAEAPRVVIRIFHGLFIKNSFKTSFTSIKLNLKFGQ